MKEYWTLKIPKPIKLLKWLGAAFTNLGKLSICLFVSVILFHSMMWFAGCEGTIFTQSCMIHELKLGIALISSIFAFATMANQLWD